MAFTGDVCPVNALSRISRVAPVTSASSCVEPWTSDAMNSLISTAAFSAKRPCGLLLKDSARLSFEETADARAPWSTCNEIGRAPGGAARV